MTTTDKDFRVKNGLVVEGNSATVNGNQVLTTASSIDSLQDVNTSGAQNTNVLSYSNGEWVPASATSGSQGTTGSQGITGSQGTTGLQGLTGSQGITGLQGIQGLIGDEGIVAQTNAPTNTDILWLDTDEPADDNSIPAGGTTGQILTKIDNADYNTQWSSPSSSGPTLEAPAYVSNRYYSSLNTNIATSTLAANITRFIPIYIWEDATFDRIAVATAPSSFSGTATVRLGIFNNTSGLPDTVLLDAGTVSCTDAGTIYAITINQTLTKGWYWLAANSQTAATVNQFTVVAGSTSLMPGLIGMSDFSAHEPYATQSVNVTSGFSTASATQSASSSYRVGLRKS